MEAGCEIRKLLVTVEGKSGKKYPKFFLVFFVERTTIPKGCPVKKGKVNYDRR